MPAMSANKQQAGAIGGICFLACAAMGLMVMLMQAFREYAPGLRDYLLWLVSDGRFGIGMLTMAAMLSLVVASVAFGVRR